MKEIRAVLQLHWIDTRLSFTIFWSILTAVTIISLVISLSLTEGNMVIGGAPAIYIYLAIHSFINVRETFPFALGMGSTRRNYHIGTFIAFAVLAAVTALIQAAYHYLGGMLFKAFDVAGEKTDAFINFWKFTGESLPASATLWLDFMIAFLILTVVNLFSSIQFRFGKLVSLSLSGLLALTIITPRINEIWVDLFRYFMKPNWFTLLSLWVPVISVLAFGISWILMRKSSSRPA